ncbi:aldehyde dehydrogenase family protein [Gordonia humi]|uniref:Aldehyde dehydrogenase (NAD+) n=1 Tax=Gordonia humi TaxID=686429 RepID=A0A840EV74_9ACTN|nr:aldehyde dehydrogenase family protein [Gordonia humi]MBB4134268.1 aldehyde dehydrogenase (NAD+) [Gordonia humi]
MTTNISPSLSHLASTSAKYLDGKFFGHVVDGVVVESLDGATLPVLDPSTGIEVATMASGKIADVDRVVGSARAVYENGTWRNMAPLEKEARLHEFARLIDEHREIFGDLDALDSGLLRSYTKFLEDFGVDATAYFAGWPSKLHGSIPPVPAGMNVQQRRVPRGVVALIVPWNGPTAVVAFAAAILATGNSVVLKAAENTPMTAVLMAELAVQAGIPAGAFNVLQGTGANVGTALVEHPGTDYIMFTGSAATGRAIQTAAAKTLTPVALELGGKSPFIVFDDVDIAETATAATATVWGGQGQVCNAGTRILVQRSIHDELVAAMVESTKESIKVGNVFDPVSTMGPLVSQVQLDRVAGYVELGKTEGADAALDGGTIGDGGFFHEPVIFTGVRNEMRIAQEEIFGPVMSVIPFDDEAEALRIANDVEYGLAAGLFTNDLRRTGRMVEGLEAGTVWVNTFQSGYPSVSYGGVKQSGYGRTMGEDMIHELTQVKSVWIAS